MLFGTKLRFKIRWRINLKPRHQKATSRQLLVDLLRQKVEDMRLQSSASTHKNRVTAVNAFGRFQTFFKVPITLSNISDEHIKAFEQWAINEGMRQGYVALHMRCLRTIINHINGLGNQLFKHVRTANCQTEKRAVNENIIRQIRELPLPDRSSQALARDIFLFCFYGMGIPLVDAVRLKKNQWQNGCITYRRKKTGRLVKIKIEPEQERLLKRLMPENSPYLLPVLTTTDRTLMQQQYRRFYQRYMRALTSISQRVGLDMPLTSYTPRHSWASIAYKLNGNVNTIAQALGHANANITYAYIKEIGDEQLANVNATVMHAVL